MKEKKIVDLAEELQITRTVIYKAIREGLLDQKNKGSILDNKKYKNFESKYKNTFKSTTIRKPKVNLSQKELDSFELDDGFEDPKNLSMEEIHQKFSVAQAKEKTYKANQEKLKFEELKGTLVKKDLIFYNIEEAFLIFSNQIGFEFQNQIKLILTLFYSDEKKNSQALKKISTILNKILDDLRINLDKIDQISNDKEVK